MRRVAAAAAVGLGAIVGPGAARADWAFTHWGMTPDQVVDASGGSAKIVAKSGRWRDDTLKLEQAATGSVRDGDAQLSVGFMFDTGGRGLACVFYNAAGDDVARLRTRLLAQFGAPSQDGDFGPIRTMAWRTPDVVEMTINADPPTAAVTQCAPGR